MSTLHRSVWIALLLGAGGAAAQDGASQARVALRKAMAQASAGSPAQDALGRALTSLDRQEREVGEGLRQAESDGALGGARGVDAALGRLRREDHVRGLEALASGAPEEARPPIAAALAEARDARERALQALETTRSGHAYRALQALERSGQEQAAAEVRGLASAWAEARRTASQGQEQAAERLLTASSPRLRQLEQLGETAPEPARAALALALQESRQGHEQALRALRGAGAAPGHAAGRPEGAGQGKGRPEGAGKPEGAGRGGQGRGRGRGRGK